MDSRTQIFRQTQVPDVPSLSHLRRPTRGARLRDSWTPARTLAFIALAPVAFLVFTSLTDGLSLSNLVAMALTTVTAAGSAFVASSYLARGALSGGSCALGPLIGLLLAGWLVDMNPNILGLAMAVVVVTAGSIQRVTRPTC
jgi:hypothetical protein